jgi:hypothetical protein
LLIGEKVLVGERGHRFTELAGRPKEEPFDLLAVVLECRLGIGVPSEKYLQSVNVVVRGYLALSSRRSIRPSRAI